ncbi:MAG TPA: HEAT repeat domain-containing protein, partial [Myxococcales bacterium]|nr:HEAT repeat domain-containing protein [Myxococcales bacterium]
MSQTDEEHRYRNVLALPLSRSGGLDPLMEALSDESWRVRKAAVDRLVSDAPVEVLVPRLIEALADEESASRRSAAMEALIKIGAGAVPAVKAAAAHADAEVRKFALDTLGLMGGEEAVDTVAGAVADADPNVRSAAVEALGRLGTAAAQGALLRILADGAPDLQVAALDALGRCGAAVPLDRLEPALKRRDARRAAVRALGHCPDPGAERAILDALLDRARGVREAALAAWAMKARRRSASLPPPAGERRDSLIPPALEGLEGADVLAAEGAADLLGCLRAREATEALARAADRDELRTVLRRALREIGPAVLEECQRDFAVLSASGRTLILEVLRDLAEGADPAFRRQAERFALHWIGTTTEQPVRLAAMALLEGVGTAEALAPLADVLGSDPEIDIAAERALGAAATAAPEGLRALCRARLRSPADVSRAL